MSYYTIMRYVIVVFTDGKRFETILNFYFWPLKYTIVINVWGGGYSILYHYSRIDYLSFV